VTAISIDVAFADAQHGWIVGSGGVIRATANGGRTWTPERARTGADLVHVQFTDRTHGWITTDNGEILRTTDGGTTWTRVYASRAKDNEEVANVMFLTPQLGWIAGSRDDGDYGAKGSSSGSLTPTATSSRARDADWPSSSPRPRSPGWPACQVVAMLWVILRVSPGSFGGLLLSWSMRRFRARAMRGAWGWSMVTVMLVGV
jgi:hypothetical protein